MDGSNCHYNINGGVDVHKEIILVVPIVDIMVALKYMIEIILVVPIVNIHGAINVHNQAILVVPIADINVGFMYLITLFWWFQLLIAIVAINYVMK